MYLHSLFRINVLWREQFPGFICSDGQDGEIEGTVLFANFLEDISVSSVS